MHTYISDRTYVMWSNAQERIHICVFACVCVVCLFGGANDLDTPIRNDSTLQALTL